MSDTPRRIRMDQWHPAELAIYNAMQEVEKMPPSVTLTNAGLKLQEAKNLVADFVDDPPINWNFKPIELAGADCKCTSEERHGWTTVKCCNHCGKSVESFWKVPVEDQPVEVEKDLYISGFEHGINYNSEILAKLSKKQSEAISMMDFAKEAGDVVGYLIWKKLNEVITDLLSDEPSPEEQEKWISVKDRLPELGNEYNVVWKPDAEEPSVTTMEYDAIEKKFIDRAGFCDSDCTDEVTHWQPLPSSPKTNPQT